jgi:hypothetical protein
MRMLRVFRVWLRHNIGALRSGATLVAWWEADRYVTLLDETPKSSAP